MIRSTIVTVLTATTIFFMAKSLTLSIELADARTELESTRTRLEQVEQELVEKSLQANSLSEWDMFTLALMKVESNYEPTAVSSVGAKGYFQITPIYVEEVNRVHKTNYKYDDVVKSFDLSYEVFTLMQEAHNQDYNMDKALLLHNGDHKWYNRRVYKEMDAIMKYEEMRQMVMSADMI
jgi:hypothetical protein